VSDEPAPRQCPYCKEEVKAGAVRCRHCHAAITPAVPAHGGVCPFCREPIHPEAIRCKHCHANLGPAGGGDCGCARRRDVGPGPRARPLGARLRVRRLSAQRTVIPPTPEQCHGCPPAIMDRSEMWCLVACDDEYCDYEMCGYV
jgi:hypothetical protein